MLGQSTHRDIKTKQRLRIYCDMNLLSCRECNFVIMSPVLWLNLGKVESLWEKVMDECAEGHPVRPRRREILDLDTLEVGRKQLSHVNTQQTGLFPRASARM